nr:exosortase family protein XrtF [Antarcticibacterium sp. 1MA-6-2]
MLQLFRKYKSVLFFILTFLGSYFLFSLFYNIYLDFSGSSNYYPDFFTHLVAVQSHAAIEAMGYAVEIVPHRGEESIIVFINDLLLARIVEGCNSISVIILFTSFILSFFQMLKPHCYMCLQVE